MTSAINRYYDPSTDQFLSIDPDVATTDQPYVFTNDDPLNAEDPLGLFCWGLCTLTDHWRGIAQGATIVVGGIADAACTISVVCDLGGNTAIGAATGSAVYAESGGNHTVAGYAKASGIGAAAAVAPEALAALGVASSSLIYAIPVNSGIGAISSVADYLSTPGKHTLAGVLKAAGNGAAQGAIPYEKIIKVVRQK